MQNLDATPKTGIEKKLVDYSLTVWQDLIYTYSLNKSCKTFTFFV